MVLGRTLELADMNNLSGLISPSELNSLDRPTGEALGLPGVAYGSAFYELEQRQLFPRAWCAVAYASDIPDPGDVLPIDFAGWPLMLVRDMDGNVRVFHNVCRHRQMQVVMAPCKGQRRVSCPWHGWTYELSGKLAATPRIGGRHESDHPDFDKTDLELVAVPSGIWLDMVFVNLDGAAAPLDQHLKPLTNLLHDYDFTGLEVGDAWSTAYPANWKLTVEGAIEDYHLPLVHPEMVQSELESHPRLDYAPGCFFANSSVREYEDDNISGEAAALESVLPRVMRTGASECRTFVISVFPTGFITTRTNHLVVFLVLPDGYRRTRLDFRHYFKGDAARRFIDLRRDMLTYWQRVFEQDLPLVGALQNNMERVGDIGVRARFSPFWESNVLQFQRSVVAGVAAGEE